VIDWPVLTEPPDEPWVMITADQYQRGWIELTPNGPEPRRYAVIGVSPAGFLVARAPHGSAFGAAATGGGPFGGAA
jgi:secreted trypsin-like serine protease